MTAISHGIYDEVPARPTAAQCAGGALDTEVYIRVDLPANAFVTTSQGFIVGIVFVRPDMKRQVRTTGTTHDIPSYHAVLCVQAKGSGTIVGPWSISAPDTVEKMTSN